MTVFRATFAILILTWTIAFGATVPSRAQIQPFRLAPADTILSQTHLILTIPLTDRQTLDETAAAIARRFNVKLTAEWPLESIGMHCLVMDAGENTDLDALITRIRADPQIRTVQRMQDFGTLESPYSDPLFAIQNALRLINALPAQRFSRGEGVKIAVVDSAIDGNHPDLAGRLAGLHDFVGDDDKAHHGEAHGTAIAGIIAADAGNATGIVGVAPEAELTGLRACWQLENKPGHCNSFSIARALNFAILHRFNIINMSLGGPRDPLLEELLQSAIANKLIVVAAGGEGGSHTFPASMPGVIAAGGSSSESVSAPSIDVITTAPHNEYRYVSGSSVATAHVTGVIALLLAAHPGLGPEEIAQALHMAVTARNGTPMLDACLALRAVIEDVLPCS